MTRLYFVTFLQQGREGIGVCEAPGDRILDLGAANQQLAEANQAVPKTLLDLIAQGDQAVGLVRRMLDLAQDLPEVWLGIDQVTLRAPIPRPRKNIVAIGLNYRAHSEEFRSRIATSNSDQPTIFTKAVTSVIGPEEVIQSHADVTGSVDYEAELAVVIGKQGRAIPAERAHDYIFGYTMVNDVTARDLQKSSSQWYMAKSLDTFCPMGPYLAYKSVVDWPVALDIRSRVNGEVRQSSNTELLIFDIPRLIEVLSKGMTLEPGDIIATGTCEGVGMGFDPPRFLKAGDVVEVEIEGLGCLRNRVG